MPIKQMSAICRLNFKQKGLSGGKSHRIRGSQRRASATYIAQIFPICDGKEWRRRAETTIRPFGAVRLGVLSRAGKRRIYDI